jgi:hypothetical protein
MKTGTIFIDIDDTAIAIQGHGKDLLENPVFKSLVEP